MKKTILITLGAILFCSCDGLLPKKITDDEIAEEDVIIQTDIEAPPPPYDVYDSDVSMLYTEHDIGEMTLYEFYSEKYFGGGSYRSDRFLSEQLKQAIAGIDKIERKTGYIILDCDPFIDAQDVIFEEDDYKVRRNGGSNWFIFSYGDTEVKILMIEENGEYYIDDVKLSSGETLTELYEKEKRRH